MIISRIFKLIGKANKGNEDCKEEDCIRFGILGAAAIAPNACINPISRLPNVVVQAVAARTRKRAESFAKQHGIPTVHATYEDLLEDSTVDAVYIPLPNSLHHEWAIKALQHGKHVLCEKPLTDNVTQALEVKAVLDSFPKLVFMEAFHWKFHPAAHFLRDILRGKKLDWNLGNIEKIESAFKIPNLLLRDKRNIRFNYELGGGIMMDAGTYAISAARYVIEQVSRNSGQEESGVAKDGASPSVIVEKATARTLDSDTRVDVAIEAELKFIPSKISASVTGMCDGGCFEFEASLVIKGSEGTLTITNFLAPSIFHSISLLKKDGSKLKHCAYGDEGDLPTYYHQMKAFTAAIQKKKPMEDLIDLGFTTIDDSIENMKVLDDIYMKAGLPIRP